MHGTFVRRHRPDRWLPMERRIDALPATSMMVGPDGAHMNGTAAARRFLGPDGASLLAHRLVTVHFFR